MTERVEPERGRRPPRATGRDALALALLLGVQALLVQRFWFVLDDAYISFRFARNWAYGHGLRFNLSDPPVEGYTNFSLVAVGALVERLGLSIEHWVPAFTAACGALLTVLAYRAIRARLGGEPLVAALACALLACSAPYAVWSTSGLETMLYALAMFATFDRLVLAPDGVAAPSAAAWALVLALTRAEGLLWVVPLAVLAALSRRARGQPFLRPLAAFALLLGLPYGAYFAWRWSTFGLPLPMTVYSKVRPSLAGLERGFDYVAAQVCTSPALLLAGPGLVAGLRRGRRAVALPAGAMCFGLAVYAVLVGGDFMTFGRFLVPALPFVALLWSFVLDDLRSARGRTLATAAGAAAAVVAALPGWNLHLVPRSVLQRFHFRLNVERAESEYEQWREQRWNGIRWSVLGRALHELTGPDDSIVTGAVGAVGYWSRRHVYDRHGLVTAEVGLLPSPPQDELRTPGHDHGVTASWFVARGYHPEIVESRIVRVGPADVAKLERWRDELRDDPYLGPRYTFEFHELRAPGSDERDARPYFVVVWRRIPEGVQPADAWRAADEALERFARTGEAPLLRVAPPERPAHEGD